MLRVAIGVCAVIVDCKANYTWIFLLFIKTFDVMLRLSKNRGFPTRIGRLRSYRKMLWFLKQNRYLYTTTYIPVSHSRNSKPS